MSEVIHTLLDQQGSPETTPPLLLLGQFERVGSTFYLDQIEKTHIVHNEPYKLLVPSVWPIAKGFEGKQVPIDDFFADTSISDVDKHWFRNFAVSLHRPGDQVVKETNLYFALPQFMEMFPDSDVRFLTRNPLGIISSFKRNGLFERWGYEGVAETLRTQLDANQPANHEALRYMLDSGDDWSSKLAWMIGLNAVLLSRHVEPGRVSQIVAYEDDIVPLGATREVVEGRAEDSIFSTNIRKTYDDFEHRLSGRELKHIGQAMERCSAFVLSEFSEEDYRYFERLYSRHIGSELGRIGTGSDNDNLGRVSAATANTELVQVRTQQETVHNPERTLIQLLESQPLLWDYSLVTNEQMSTFLQQLIEHGHDPSNNHLLLLDSMSPSRGGRILFDKEKGHFSITEGFSDHPAYWITWLGAALYAYKEGMRLPTFDEWEQVFTSSHSENSDEKPNHSYAFDDTTPTGIGESKLPLDFFGNLKIWCADWSNDAQVSKKLAGISWKNDYHDAYRYEGERPYLTNSRMIGARLVCCSECKLPEQHTMDEVADKLHEIIQLITDTPIHTGPELASLNTKISESLITECAHQNTKIPQEMSVA